LKILIVDDDPTLRSLVAYAFRQEGFLVLEAIDGPAALQAIDDEAPELVVLDVNLPRMNGFEIVKRMRSEQVEIPVLLLTARSDEEDQIRGLELGADDYLTKPFSPRTLIARVHALLRRAGRDRPGIASTGRIELDLESQIVRVDGNPGVRLTHLEFRLLQLLLSNAGRTMDAERLSAHVWGYRGRGDRQLLKQLVRRLRQKLEEDPSNPRFLLTAPGIGYVLQSDPSQSD
jgi:DNA-binding response OmpR family regulator